jgi:diguanylate cyclase (GGDEF)-like protein/PAS domain S-box-containing protein
MPISNELHLQWLNEQIMTLEVALDGTITDASPAYLQRTGFSDDNLLGKSIQTIIHPSILKDFLTLWNNFLEEKNFDGDVKSLSLHKDTIWTHIYAQIVDQKVYILFHDITELQDLKALNKNLNLKNHHQNEKLNQAMNEMKETKELFKSVLNAQEQLVITYENKKIISTNETFNDFFQVDTIDEFENVYGNLENCFHQNVPDEYIKGSSAHLFWIDYIIKDGFKEHKVVIVRNAKQTIFRVSATFIKTPTRQLRSVVLTDITEHIEAQETIKQLAYYDALTNLPNRILFKDRLHSAIESAKRHHELVAVLYLDLDRFKMVNDTLGHSIGDKLLVDVASRIESVLRKTDTVSRVGGDEFIIILPELKESQGAIIVAKKIVQVMQQTFMIDDNEIITTTSVGITYFPDQGQDAETLIKNADTAMYQAKEQGKNNWKIFETHMHSNMSKQLKLEQDLKDALESEVGGLTIFYQPKVELNSNRLKGAEVLIRWHHKEHGLLFPDTFIPMAENTGLIIPLGEFVIEEAVKQIAKWRKEEKNIQLAVNLSGRQFQSDGLVTFIKQTLQAYDVPPHLLECEVTESISMNNIKNSLRILKDLKELGVELAMDDFGTGYSSLAYLKQFPLDTLKIDRAFVMNMVEDSDDKAIAQLIISMGRTLGMHLVAEGVESSEHVNLLNYMQCDYAQGYHYSKPIAIDEFEKLFDKFTISQE